ncbi:MAG TPA: DUF1080 domain-containing protein [Opitutaceae bacterium]
MKQPLTVAFPRGPANPGSRTRTRFTLLLALSGLGGDLATGLAASTPGSVDASATAVAEVIKLFDGQTLNGLYVWSKEHGYSDPEGVFKVENGMIHVASDQPYAALSTHAEYRDYMLILEFKWGARTFGKRLGKARDAGLLLHARGRDGEWHGQLMPNIEAQIMEGAMGDLMVLKGLSPMSLTSTVVKQPALTDELYYRGGYRWSPDGPERTFTQDLGTVHWSKWDPHWTNVAGYRGAHDLEKPLGQWNQMIVVADGDRLEVFFNGEKVNEAAKVQPSAGRIQLESEQAEYFVRRWELRPLKPSGGSPAVEPGRLINLSVRANLGAGERTPIMGFVVGGGMAGGSRPLLIRGAGPALKRFAVAAAAEDAALVVYHGSEVVAANDDWRGDVEVASLGEAVGAAPFASADSKDAAMVRSFAAGAYTVHATGAGGGIALAEIFDTPNGSATAAEPRLVNASSRGFVGTGEGILIVGFVIGGSSPVTVLVRAIGAGLGPYGVQEVLANPRLALFAGGAVLASNDDWSEAANAAQIATAAADVGAFALPSSSADAAILVSLPPGAYTAQVSGVGDMTGVALAEIYEVR